MPSKGWTYIAIEWKTHYTFEVSTFLANGFSHSVYWTIESVFLLLCKFALIFDRYYSGFIDHENHTIDFISI